MKFFFKEQFGKEGVGGSRGQTHGFLEKSIEKQAESYFAKKEKRSQRLFFYRNGLAGLLLES